MGSVVAAFGGYMLVRSWVREVEEADRASTRLTVALRQQTDQQRVTREEMDDLASAMQQLTTVGDDAVKTIEAQLLGFNATKAQLPELISLILDLAAAGENVGSVTEAIGGGLNGQFGGLQRLLKVGFDSAKSDAENFAEAIQIIRERYGGLAQELAKTPTGQLAQLRNNIADLKEEMGKAVLQAGAPWVAMLNDLVRGVNSFTAEWEKSRTVLASAFSGIAAGLGTISVALLAVKSNALLAGGGLSTLSGGKAGAVGAGIVGAVSITAAAYEAYKLMQDKETEAASGEQLLAVLERQRAAIRATAEEMVKSGALAKEAADDIASSLQRAFDSKDVDKMRQSLVLARSYVRPDLAEAGTPAQAAARERLTLEQVQARAELDKLILGLEMDVRRGRERDLALAAQERSELLSQIDALTKKGQVTEEQADKARGAANDAYQMRRMEMDAQIQIQEFEHRITLASKLGSSERSVQIQREFELRIALYERLLKAAESAGPELNGRELPAGITRSQFDKLAREAQMNRANEFAAQSSGINSERESLLLGAGERYELGIQRRKEAVAAYYNFEIEQARAAGQATGDIEERKAQHLEALSKRQTYTMKQLYDGLKNLEEQAIQGVASGMTEAFGAMIEGTKSAEQAWADFGRSFLKMIADIILQLIITIALKAALRALGVPGFADGGMAMSQPGGLVKGGIRYAASGLDGVDDVSSPTYFPRFNVMAGEAGREMLTVLARPQYFEQGGMRGVMGLAQGRSMVIMPAEQLGPRLQRAAAGYSSQGVPNAGGLNSGQGEAGPDGRVVIEVRPAPDAEARIVEQSVRRARVDVVEQAGNASALNKAIRRAVA